MGDLGTFWSDLGMQNHRLNLVLKITPECSVPFCKLGWYLVGAQLKSNFTHHLFRLKSDGLKSGKNGFGVFFKTSSDPFKFYLSSGENHNEGAKTSARPTMIKEEQLARL